MIRPPDDTAAPATSSALAGDAGRPVRAGDLVRLARREELPLLAAVERAAAERFRGAGMPEIAEQAPIAREVLSERHSDGSLWVAVSDDTVVGFAMARELAGLGWLDEVSVVPAHGGRGLGRLLVEEALLWALRRGYATLGRTRTLDSHASRLRRKLDPENGRYVVNCWGYGYRLVDG